MKESASGTPRIKSRGGESVSFSEEPGVNLAVRKKKVGERGRYIV